MQKIKLIIPILVLLLIAETSAAKECEILNRDLAANNITGTGTHSQTEIDLKSEFEELRKAALKHEDLNRVYLEYLAQNKSKTSCPKGTMTYPEMKDACFTEEEKNAYMAKLISKDELNSYLDYSPEIKNQLSSLTVEINKIEQQAKNKFVSLSETMLDSKEGRAVNESYWNFNALSRKYNKKIDPISSFYNEIFSLSPQKFLKGQDHVPTKIVIFPNKIDIMRRELKTKIENKAINLTEEIEYNKMSEFLSSDVAKSLSEAESKRVRENFKTLEKKVMARPNNREDLVREEEVIYQMEKIQRQKDKYTNADVLMHDGHVLSYRLIKLDKRSGIDDSMEVKLDGNCLPLEVEVRSRVNETLVVAGSTSKCNEFAVIDSMFT
ncbi:MAG: hypothetical protein AABY64_02825, partial [Bdellovibrionota bacterium]